MKTVIVERTLTPPMTIAELARQGAAGKSCFDLRRARLVRTLVSLDGTRVVCEYLAPDAESVREANRKAGLPFDRVWSAEVTTFDALGPAPAEGAEPKCDPR